MDPVLSDDAGAFGISPKALAGMNQYKNNEELADAGHTTGIMSALHTDPAQGLKSSDVEQHRAHFGPNKYREVPPTSFLRLLLEALKDPIIILLMCAATVSTVLGLAIDREENHWIEGIAIWVAVILVAMVGSVTDYKKELQFRAINAISSRIQVKVIRDGSEQLVVNDELVVGDVMVLDTGDNVVADGLYISGYGLKTDESALTGEPDMIKKSPEKDPWCRSGTQVTDGNGIAVVTAVGATSEWGIIMDKVAGAPKEDTPLQEKLAVVAAAIGKIGFGVAFVAFFVLLIRWCVKFKGFPLDEINNNGPIQFFLYGVTIIVVAVPEGLPLAVTLSLSYSMRKMMKDNNFVRHLAACETMGGATAICSDKTGTLTENRMTVVEGWFQGTRHRGIPKPGDLSDSVRTEIVNNICLNSKAFYMEESGRFEFVGNRTDCALLVLCQRDWGVSYEEVRKAHDTKIANLYAFSSAKKMASVLVDRGDGTLRLYNKGASEWVLAESVAYVNEQGSAVPLTPEKRAELEATVTELATRGLRTLVLTYTDFQKDDPSRAADFFEESPDHNLTVLCVVGIKDPVRPEVPGAVATCKRAGIFVRMVTGDNIHTAKHIAEECGILQPGGLAMEGPDFRNTPEEEMMAKLPQLQVLARSSPTDKHTLVCMLKKLGEVVAVTGDGTNDAPALSAADVGLAMGIAGTEVAKKAAHIVILDDNFKSIVLAVLWGRSVFNNIRKFLQFQLTVNIVALVIAFIGSFVSKEPLNVLQLLWVNLIMDTLAALALATENPHVTLLSHKPAGRKTPLISPTMWKHMIIQSLYQITWMLLILFAAPKMFDRYKIRGKCEVFNANQGFRSSEPAFCASSRVTGRVGGTAICERLFVLGTVDPELPYACPMRFDDAGGPEGWCAPGEQDCPTYETARGVWDDWGKFLGNAIEHDEETSKSLLFNAFIFMQLFNELNARKILDEYNIVEGVATSPIFVSVLVITVILQIIIVQTPVASIFKVNALSLTEWAVSVAIGFGAIPLSLLTRFVSRAILGINVPKPGCDEVEMDIGYGAKVVPLGGGHLKAVPDLIHGAGKAEHDAALEANAEKASAQRSVIGSAHDAAFYADAAPPASGNTSPPSEGYILS